MKVDWNNCMGDELVTFNSISLMEEAMTSKESRKNLVINCKLKSGHLSSFMVNLPESWDHTKIRCFCLAHLVNFSEVLSIETIN
jgi:hypothetical protein